VERPKKIVVDASVAIRWCNVEQHAQKALAIREDYAKQRIDLVASYLLPYEVGNALRYLPVAILRMMSMGWISDNFMASILILSRIDEQEERHRLNHSTYSSDHTS